VHACRASGWIVLSIPSAHAYFNFAPAISPLSMARVDMTSVGLSESDGVYDPLASTQGLMRGLLAVHEDALLELPLKRPESASFSDESGVRLDTLGDVVQLGATDEALAPHALVLTLRELCEVEQRPVAIIVDDANAFEHGTVFSDPSTMLPLEASQFLLSQLMPSPVAVGAQMKRGLVVCAESATCTFQPSVSKRLKKRQRQRLRGAWGARDAASAVHGAAGVARISVPNFSPQELESVLNYYIHTGAWRPMGDFSLEHSSKAAVNHVHMLTASNGEHVRRLCTQLA